MKNITISLEISDYIPPQRSSFYCVASALMDKGIVRWHTPDDICFEAVESSRLFAEYRAWRDGDWVWVYVNKYPETRRQIRQTADGVEVTPWRKVANPSRGRGGGVFSFVPGN